MLEFEPNHFTPRRNVVRAISSTHNSASECLHVMLARAINKQRLTTKSQSTTEKQQVFYFTPILFDFNLALSRSPSNANDCSVTLSLRHSERPELPTNVGTWLTCLNTNFVSPKLFYKITEENNF